MEKEDKVIEMIPKEEVEDKAMKDAEVAPDPWEALDIEQSPFKWPDEERNLYTNGTQCSLWGRSTADMKQADLILFIGYLNILYSQAAKGMEQMLSGASAEAVSEAGPPITEMEDLVTEPEPQAETSHETD